MVYGLRLEVNQATLIPRPETEELVEWIIESQTKNTESQTCTILDVGTGSGCIPISLKQTYLKLKFMPLMYLIQLLQLHVKMP